MAKILIRSLLLVLGVVWSVSGPLPAQQEPPTLVERLGYPPSARLLIVHADDLGLSNSVNQASFAGLKRGLVSSASVMVPCSWTPQVAAEARANPEWDLGIHLTFNAEWEQYKWGPTSPRRQVPSLVDPLGYLYATVEEAVQKIDPGEAEIEIRAQIEKAMASGIEPTHLDSHMGTLFRTSELLGALLRVGREYRLPVFLPGNLLGMAPFAQELLTEKDIVIDYLVSMFPQHPDAVPERWFQGYAKMISDLKPGVTQLIVHLGYDDPELRAIAVNHPDFGADWRQRDFEFVTSEEFARLLEKENIKLITWREIGKLLK